LSTTQQITRRGLEKAHSNHDANIDLCIPRSTAASKKYKSVNAGTEIQHFFSTLKVLSKSAYKRAL